MLAEAPKFLSSLGGGGGAAATPDHVEANTDVSFRSGAFTTGGGDDWRGLLPVLILGIVVILLVKKG
jgi:hypothetical protein